MIVPPHVGKSSGVESRTSITQNLGQTSEKGCSTLGDTCPHVNGGSSDFAMCPGLIDMPGQGKQWLAERTLKGLLACDIQ